MVCLACSICELSGIRSPGLLSRKCFAAWKEFFSRILRALCVLAVSAGQQFNRQGAKDAKNTRSKTVWSRRNCAVMISHLSPVHAVLVSREVDCDNFVNQD